MTMTRRAFGRALLELALARSFLARALAAEALVGPPSTPVKVWLEGLYANARDLRAHRLESTQWQDHVEALYRQVSLEEVVKAIDLERLLTNVDYPANAPAIRDVTLPPVAGLGEPCPFQHKVFALQRDAAVVPHGHTNMVSCHLVLRGTVRVRTFDRVRDERDAMWVRPHIDAEYHPGQVLTMSRYRDNVHWLVATSEHAATFDTPLKEIWPGRHGLIPDDGGRIYVDPTAKPGSDGLIRARVLDKHESYTRFGRAG